MRVALQQLSETLTKRLAPVVLITGDEPLQTGEAADAVRNAAKQQGFTEREVLSVDAHFAWHALSETAGSLSLFGDKKIIDLRIPDGKLGQEGSKALQAYCERPPSDTLLLISTAKLPGTALKTRWYEAVDTIGLVVQVWPLDGRELIHWLQQRAVRRGLTIAPDAIKLLASKIEGNLLAAAQEIEKLYILHGQQPISEADVMDSVANSARYDVFKLVDALHAGRPGRIMKILQSLKEEGIALPVVLWAITREARLLLTIQEQIHKGQPREMLFKRYQIWDKRKGLINDALAKSSPQQLLQVLLLSGKADQQIKGQQAGDPWETLLHICWQFTGKMMVKL